MNQFDDDLGAIFNDVFSVEAIFPSGGPITVIFDRPYGEASGIAGNKPVIWARSSDVSAVAVDTDVTVDGCHYTVALIEPDGTGVTMLVLQEAEE